MHGHDQTALHIQKVGQHPVIQLRRENLQEGNLPDFPAHGEVFAVPEGKGAGRDKVLHRKPGGSQPVPVKQERLLLVHVEDAVEQLQTLFSVHRVSLNAQPLEVVQHIGLNALQPELGAFQRIGLDAEGQVLGLDMELQQELVKKANNKEAYDEIADQIFALREKRQQASMDTVQRDEQLQRITELQDFIKDQSSDLTVFDEALVKRWLKQIVIWPTHCTVELKSGLKVDVER